MKGRECICRKRKLGNSEFLNSAAVSDCGCLGGSSKPGLSLPGVEEERLATSWFCILKVLSLDTCSHMHIVSLACL